MRVRFGVLAGAVALAGAAILAGQSDAQIKKGKTRPLTTAQLMAGLIKPAATDLGKELQGSGPADEKGWQAAAMKAALLNETAHVMMADGRCPDQVWADACKTLQEKSRLALEKIEARDAPTAREALNAMMVSCKGCHTAHKR